MPNWPMSPVPQTKTERPWGSGACEISLMRAPVRRRLTTTFLGSAEALRPRLVPLATGLGASLGAGFSSALVDAGLLLDAGLPLEAGLAASFLSSLSLVADFGLEAGLGVAFFEVGLEAAADGGLEETRDEACVRMIVNEGC